ncbi:MAG: acetyl-CoA carboxylase biotin carboxyl carrier protein [Chitinophagales bacterium]
MDLKQIQELIKLVKKNDISELKIREGDFGIAIKNRGSEQPTFVTTAPVAQTVAPASQAPAKQDGAKAESQEKPAATEPKNDNLVTFKSPMVGTFYRKPGADKDPYVKVGDVIKGGDVLCIIEAMKLFNEIEFDGGEGRVVKILAEDASPVEYDQPLFLIEKV